MLYGQNKKYLSYSAIEQWYQNKEAYRKRYYGEKKTFDTAYTLFGKEVHSAIESSPLLEHIPKLKGKEVEIKVKFRGVTLRGFIDTFDKKTKRFFEYKTGIVKPDGESRWTIDRVNKHKQLPFYALLIREKFGDYNPDTLLVHLETEWKREIRKQGSVELSISEELILTGRAEIFKRHITKEDIEEIEEWIIKASKEINDDYKTFRKTSVNKCSV